MRSIAVLAILYAMALAVPVAAAPNDPLGTSPRRFEAPVGHRQPTARDVDQARASKKGVPQSDSGLTEAERKAEGDIRSKLQICRGC